MKMRSGIMGNSLNSFLSPWTISFPTFLLLLRIVDVVSLFGVLIWTTPFLPNLLSALFTNWFLFLTKGSSLVSGSGVARSVCASSFGKPCMVNWWLTLRDREGTWQVLQLVISVTLMKNPCFIASETVKDLLLYGLSSCKIAITRFFQTQIGTLG